jgi:hypothetical protein
MKREKTIECLLPTVGRAQLQVEQQSFKGKNVMRDPEHLYAAAADAKVNLYGYGAPLFF